MVTQVGLYVDITVHTEPDSSTAIVLGLSSRLHLVNASFSTSAMPGCHFDVMPRGFAWPNPNP